MNTIKQGVAIKKWETPLLRPKVMPHKVLLSENLKMYTESLYLTELLAKL